MLIRIPGISLKTVPLEKQSCTVTIFTPSGLISVFAKSGLSPNFTERETLLPITHAYYTFTHHPPKMRRFTEAEIINPYLEIKTNYNALMASGKMIEAILSTQWKEKPSKDLYVLFANLLHRIPKVKYPQTLASAFLLKLMKYEGILADSPYCRDCKKHLTDTVHRYKGYRFCAEHSPAGSIPFSRDEERFLLALISSKKFSNLEELANFNVCLKDSISKLFNTIIED
ncbi:DNA repair protein RecO [Chlamydiifrater phoenicopteri]|uniref:DNA repair protein RecO n=1 Tax=Chlamydiifrater phoenicopteri TaxID=2681469 RepID=UPI001BD19368|nr:DNA repair protein RecO [Chlamydiifrater phoenicopteri]